MRICSRSDCSKAGILQDDNLFYHHKSECKPCSLAQGKAARKRWLHKIRTSPFVVDREPSARLPIGPLRVWLEKQILLAGTADAFAEGVKGSGDVRFPARQIYRWRYESTTVDLDAIDQFLCAFGAPEVLRELWPELYDLPDFDESLERIAA